MHIPLCIPIFKIMQRRDFLKISAMGTAAAMMPFDIMAAPTATAKNGSANGKINLGFIGLGQQSVGLMNCFITLPEVRIVAGCDVFDTKRDRFQRNVKKYYESKGET